MIKETLIRLSAIHFTEKYAGKQEKQPSGTLCFWGQWFGRPLDNIHKIIAIEFDEADNSLSFTFSEEEKLTIRNPGYIDEFKNRIEITTADHVHWQWFDHGKKRSLKSLYYYDFMKTDTKIIGRSNIHWSAVDHSELSINKPAVQLIGF